MEKLVLIVALLALHMSAAVEAHCTPSITKVSAGDVPLGQLCSGQLVLNEDFNTLDTQVPAIPTFTTKREWVMVEILLF